MSHGASCTWVFVFCIGGTGQRWGVVGLCTGSDITAPAVAGPIGY